MVAKLMLNHVVFRYLIRHLVISHLLQLILLSYLAPQLIMNEDACLASISADRLTAPVIIALRLGELAILM